VKGHYDPWLVMLSVAVAVMASYVALDLASRIAGSARQSARYWLAGGAVSMGMGIWSMHFIGMLAFRLPMPTSYSVSITLLSLLIAVVVSAFALHTVRRDSLGAQRLVAGGVLMGIGIVSMHYTGMAAMMMSAPIRYRPGLFGLSIVIAITASWAGLWILFRLRDHTLPSHVWRKGGSALLMGGAISGMHYTGMAAAIFPAYGTAMTTAPPMPDTWLAVTVAAFTIVLLATILVVSVAHARHVGEVAKHESGAIALRALHDELEQRVHARTAELADANAALQAEVGEHERTEKALRASEDEARAIIDTAYDAYIAIDADSVILDWNQQAEHTFGWSHAEVMGRTLTELIIPEQFRDAHVRGIRHFLATGEGPVLDRRIELTALHREGYEFPVELTIWPTKVGETCKFSAFLHDIRRQRAIRRLAAQTAAAATLVESATLAEAAPKVLQEVCEAMGWTVGVLWEVDREREALRCVEFWHAEDTPTAAFMESTRSLSLARGAGLPGRIWEQRLPLWVADGTLDPLHPREAAAVQSGLHGAIGFPILSGTQVLGVAEFHASAIPAPDPQLNGMMETLGSLLGQFMARKQAERALADKEQHLAEAQRIANFGSWEWRAIGDQITCSDELYRIHRGEPADFGNTLSGYLRHVHAADLPRFRRTVYTAFRRHQSFDIEHRIVCMDGTERVLQTRGRTLVDERGRTVGMVGSAQDITERKEAERRLRQLAHFDPLTGLPNRRFFHESLQSAMAVADRQDWRVFLFFLDLDHFKNINDSLGHMAGDELLRQVTQRLLGCLRVRDTVARLGGDEFGIILLMPDDPQIAVRIADKILDALNLPFELEGQAVTTTASIGITVYPTDTSDLPTLVRYADLAMYEAKKGGRNDSHFYTDAMNLRAREKLELEVALRRALMHDEFELHYQPKVSLRTGRWTGVEALLRWSRPEFGMVPPAEFIPVLEETGLIVAVGARVITAACQQLRDWERQGLQSLPIAVNVSAHQVARKHLPMKPMPGVRRPGPDSDGAELWSATAACLERHGVAPGLLELELTESTVMSDAEHSVEMLRRLKDLGLRISVDDFGTGYSSLAYLRRFPVDAIKIDGSFVRDLGSDAGGASIVLAIIDMAHRLNLKVIAECVETAEQVDFLREHGCDEVQGYFIARPMPADELLRLWRETGGRALPVAA
jgi:diguanylate cyclase (GGDEF)-like protein/PAS domain S-box-containing protein